MAFSVSNTCIAYGNIGSDITWTFDGDVGRAEHAGATAYAELRADGSVDLRITARNGKVLADVVVNKLTTDDSITISLMNVGCALLWGHQRRDLR